MSRNKVDVILPAGGRLTGDFAREAGASIKALIRIDGTCMLERTIETLRQTGETGRIVVVGPTELALHPASRRADAVLPEGTSGPENILIALEYLQANGGASERVLVVTTDLPFITPESLSRFLNACPSHAEICVPILRREEFLSRFSGSPATFAPLQDGEWTMAGAFLLDPAALLRNRQAVQRVFDARKSEFAMARLLGPLFVLRYLTRMLRVEDIEKRCSRILGCRGVAVRNAPAELAADIDNVEEYRYLARGATLACEHGVAA